MTSTQTSNRTSKFPFRLLQALLALPVAAALTATPASAAIFQENWDGTLDSRVILGGNAAQVDGHIRLTEAANGQGGNLILTDLDPGEAVTAFSASMKIFIGGGTGADGLSFNFGDIFSLGSVPEGIDTGLAVSLDTYNNGGGDLFNAVVVRYDGATILTGASTTLRTGSYVSMDVKVYPNGFIRVEHDNNVTEGTIPGWTPVAGRRFLWSAATGGLNDEHSVEDVAIATFTSNAYHESFATGPVPNVTFYGSAHQESNFARITDNVVSQTGSLVVDDLNPGVGIASFGASFDKYIFDGGGADGISFNFGDVAAGAFGEGGSGNGLIVSWPTFGGDKVRVFYGGALIVESGSRNLRGQWTRVSVAVDSSGRLFVTDTADGVSIAMVLTTIPGWNPQPGWRFAIGGRTGAVSDSQAINFLSIQTDACGDGTLDPGEQCDDSNVANGDCCSSTCQFETVGSFCGDAGTECVVQDTCDGAGSCVDNGFELSGTNCGDTGTECVVQDTCDGAGSCSDNGFELSGTSCGSGSATECTDPDTCDGAGACQANDALAGTTCGDAGTECVVQDTCDGAGSCSDNGFELSGTSCGSSSDTECTNPDSCDGAGVCDPNDESSTFSCRASANSCDAEELCDGAGSCPADVFLDNGTVCDDGDACTTGDVCTDGVCAGNADLCGDSTTQGACGEECDDGNLDPGDGCDEQCLNELCPATPNLGCLDVAQAKIQVSEKKPGGEKLKMQWKKVDTATTQGEFGDPVAGPTAVALCIYNDAGNLVRSYDVDRAGTLCDEDPCWSAKSTKGYQYKDGLAASDGITGIKFGAGDVGKGKAAAQGKNNSKKGQTSLPTEIVAQLAGNETPTIQLVTDAGFCVSATMTDVKKDDGETFQASKK